jgi:hypothetical protein
MQFSEMVAVVHNNWAAQLFGPDPDPSHHFYYLLFAPPAIASCFLFAALVTRSVLFRNRPLIVRVPIFLLTGSCLSLIFIFGLSRWQQQFDSRMKMTILVHSSNSSELSGNSSTFAQAFCLNAMDQARTALNPAILQDEAGLQTAISDCLTTPSADGLHKVLLREKVPLLIDAIMASPRERQQSLVELLLKQLYAYRDYGDLHRLKDLGFSMHATYYDVSPNEPLWWLVSSWDGQPPTLEDLWQLESLGIDLRERDALGAQFIFQTSLLHQVSTPVLVHLVDLGIDRNAIGYPRAIAVEAMYRRFGWNRESGNARDLEHLLEAVGEPSSEELRREAADPNSDPRIIGPGSVDRSRIRAFREYLASHGLDAGGSSDQTN